LSESLEQLSVEGSVIAHPKKITQPPHEPTHPGFFHHFGEEAQTLTISKTVEDDLGLTIA